MLFLALHFTKLFLEKKQSHVKLFYMPLRYLFIFFLAILSFPLPECSLPVFAQMLSPLR